MKTKLEMAHEWYMMQTRRNGCALVVDAWKYADAMQAEADKRNKAEAEQKRKAIREMINADNTFLEKEGQHFDDVEWQPDWSQSPKDMNYFFVNKDGSKFWTINEPDKPNLTEHVMNFSDCGGDCYAYASSQDYQGDWRESLRKRPQ